MVRENAYILLGLDPDTHTTWVDIEPVFKRKKTEWAMPHPTHKLRNQQYRSWQPELERVLKDDDLRKQEADEARTILLKQRAAAAAELDQVLRITGAKGYLTDDDIRSILASSGRRWTEQQIRDVAGQLNLKIQAARPKATVAKPRLDQGTEDAIASALTLLGMADLYALLGLSASISTRELLRAADTEYQKIRTHSDRTRPDVNARQELLGHCMTLFSSESEREKYDNSLAWQRMKEIEKLTEAAGAGEGRIPAQVTDELLKQGKKLGLSQEDVTTVITDVASRKRWPLEVPSVASSESLVRCSACGELSASRDKACSACGTPFQIACPQCGTSNPTGATHCSSGSCRFEVGNMPLAERLLRSARALQTDDPANALRLVMEALTYWPGHPEAIALKAEFDRVTAETQKSLEEIHRWIRAREFETARRSLDAFSSRVPNHPDIPRLEQDVNTALTEAAGHVARGRSLHSASQMDDAFDAFDAAMGVCADHQEARDWLLRCTPLPPTDLKGLATTNGIALAWRPSPSRGQIQYLVVRKVGSHPTNPSDGDQVGTTSSSPLTDNSARSGTSYYYAVFSERSGSRSHQAATVGPLIRIADVSDFKVQVDDRQVCLEWTPPFGVRSIEVWRQVDQEPAERGDGIRVACTLNSAIDSNLANGCSYGYRVIAVFNGPEGTPLATNGVTSLVTPTALPPPVTDLDVQIHGDEFQASWTRPATGLVQIFRLKSGTTYLPGEVISMTNVHTLGQPLPTSGVSTIRGSVAGETEVHLFPVTVVGSAYVAGTGVSRTWVPEMAGVSVSNRAEGLTVSWKWPAGIVAALVVARKDSYPDAPDDSRAACQTRVTIDQYRAAGGCVTLSVTSVGKLFVTVFGAVNRNGTWDYAPGRDSGCRTEVIARGNRTIRYTVHAKGSYFGFAKAREYAVGIVSDGPVELPELLVVSMPHGLPVKPSDGTVLLRTSPTTVTPDRPVEIGGIKPPAWKVTNQNTTLFHAHDIDGKWLELLRDY
jgi:predicted RNA-binding Zn-ribbon protein involved in translation (DUF1610 family)